MTRFILTRAFYSLITLWLLVTIVFGFVRFTGDPATMLEEVGDKAYVEQLREQWGLDRPYIVQYGKYLWGLLQGDFGNSFQKSLAVRDIYFERLPNSLKLHDLASHRHTPGGSVGHEGQHLVGQFW